MLRISALVVTLMLASGPAAAEQQLAFFNYDKPMPPVGGDCAAISAAVGPGGTWYGEFSGRRYDNFADRYFPFGAQGCFESEWACRVWQNRAITYLDRGPMNYSTCRRGR